MSLTSVLWLARISGATKPDQVQANAAAGAWIMTADERAELSSL